MPQRVARYKGYKAGEKNWLTEYTTVDRDAWFPPSRRERLAANTTHVPGGTDLHDSVPRVWPHAEVMSKVIDWALVRK